MCLLAHKHTVRMCVYASKEVQTDWIWYFIAWPLVSCGKLTAADEHLNIKSQVLTPVIKSFPHHYHRKPNSIAFNLPRAMFSLSFIYILIYISWPVEVMFSQRIRRCLFLACCCYHSIIILLSCRTKEMVKLIAAIQTKNWLVLRFMPPRRPFWVH